MYRRKNIAHLIVSVIFIVVISITGWFHFDKKQQRFISWDTFGYYLYLPSLFIYDDPGLEKQEIYEKINEKYGCTYTFYQFSPGKDERSVIKYNSGLSFIFLPFFAAAHAVAIISGAEPDGFSPPYQWAVFLSYWLFCIAGVFLLKRLLLLFFDSRTALYTLICILFGTNLLFMMGYPLSVHMYLFTCYAAFLLVSYRWNEKPGIKNSLLMGFLAGAIILIRPTDLPVWLIPLLWNVYSVRSLNEKLKFLYLNKKYVITAALTAFIVFLPQLLYWKYTTGSWFYNGYTNAGEGLDWTNPHTIDFLFSFRKGWFIYTPLMLFGVAGFYFLYQKNRKIFLPLFLFFIVNLFLVSSWTNWWYAGSFSSRAITQSYAVMAIPLGYFISGILAQKTRYKVLVFSLFGLLVSLNLFQTWQYQENIIDAERMTRKYYFSTFLQTSPPDEASRKLLLAERPDIISDTMPHSEDYLLTNSFLVDYLNASEIDSRFKINPDSAGETGILMSPENMFTPLYRIRYHELTRFDHAVIRVSARIYTSSLRPGNTLHCVTYFEYKGKVYTYRTTDPVINSDTSSGKWSNFQFYYTTPDVRTVNDDWVINFWYTGNDSVYVSNLKLDIYEPVKYGIRR